MPYIGELAALTGAFFWGICSLLFESATKRIGATMTNLIRLFMATVLLSVSYFISTGEFFPMGASSGNYLWLGISGIVGLVIGDGALFKSLYILGSRRTMLLMSIAPPVTAALAWIYLGETLGWLAIAGIFITISGVFWVINEKVVAEQTNGSKFKGVVYGLIAALGQAAGLVLAKYGLGNSISPLGATLLRMAPATIVLAIVMLLTGKRHKIIPALKNNRTMLITLGGAVFGPFLGVWLSIVAIKYTETGIASTLLATVPVLILPMIVIVYKTKLSLRAVGGAVIAVIGIALLFLH